MKKRQLDYSIPLKLSVVYCVSRFDILRYVPFGTAKTK